MDNQVVLLHGDGDPPRPGETCRTVTLSTVHSLVYVVCGCGEQFYASGKTTDAVLKLWTETHGCRLKKMKKAK
jgi:hypothetical protein